MVNLKDSDFVELDFDIYANNKLVQTTKKKNAIKNGLKIDKFGPQTIVLGKNFLLKALDENIKKQSKINEQITLELKAEDAYGKRKKDLLKVFPKSVFEEQKTKAVVGIMYDFNGMLGTVKSVTGSRILVDFNNPLAGKNIKIEYTILKIVENIVEKINLVFELVLKLPKDKFKIEHKEKEITLLVPSQVDKMSEQITKMLGEFIPNMNDYNVRIETFKN